MKRESRYKLFKIDNITVLSMLNWNTHEYISLPITKGLPPNAVIEAINYNVERNCFLARVYHESFDIVEDGLTITIDDEWLRVEQHTISIEQYKRASKYETIDSLLSKAIDEDTLPSTMDQRQ